MNNNSQSGGAMIAMALFFAVIGILFGLGRLKAYEYQVSRRIDRQYQIEKMLVTRSGLAVIKSECTPNNYDVFPVYSNLIYRSENSSEEICCEITPTPDTDRQNMSNDFDSVWGWYASEGAGVAPVLAGTAPVISTVLFEVGDAVPTNSYTCAIFKKVDDFWLKNQFGYLYLLDMDMASSPGLGKLRLYLVGVGGNNNPDVLGVRGENTLQLYHTRMQLYPSIMMEMSVEPQNGTNYVVRRFQVRDPSGVRPIYDESWRLGDQTTQAGGFLLSGTQMVGFGQGSDKDFRFTEGANGRVNLTSHIETNDFRNAWIVIEHMFPTNSAGTLNVSVDSFVMREPTTYSVTVYNKKLAAMGIDNDVEKRLSTWVFQTVYPVSTKVGKQCVLDTFGAEPASLKKERRGVWSD